MHDDLLALLKQRYGDSPEGVDRHHFTFAVSNRERARKLLTRIKQRTEFHFRNSRVLDIGCAYAGFVLAAAAVGAEAWGVEIEERFYACGEANTRGEAGHIRLLHGDILSESIQDSLPRDFDLIVINDVFEHVYDTTRLLKHAATLLKPGGLLVFTVPNGNALDFIEKEGHNLQLGLSLLPPAEWRDVVNWFSTYYRPWGYFVALLNAFGFNRIDTWNEPTAQTTHEIAGEIEQRLARIAELVAASDYRPALRERMAGAVLELAGRAAADARRDSADLLHWKYRVRFWEGCAFRNGEADADVSRYA
ncbi:Ubiquinone biosynthesis O-methyltransferase [Phycisphaerae bacterium RAS1]|nr:Ubiquinone biosynthesis O-methyltransferase [Phycisphaerae bacterium RAS1]